MFYIILFYLSRLLKQDLWKSFQFPNYRKTFINKKLSYSRNKNDELRFVPNQLRWGRAFIYHVLFLYILFTYKKLFISNIQKAGWLVNIGIAVVRKPFYISFSRTFLIRRVTLVPLCRHVIFNTRAVPYVSNNGAQQTAFHASFLSLKRIKRTRVNFVYARLFVC